MSIFKRRFTYANVTATLALVFAMSGGAMAASHYLVNSTRQINPAVLKKLKGNTGRTGRTGPAGKEGAVGKEGPTGKEGPAGPTGKEGPAGKEGVITEISRWRTTIATAGASEAEANTVTLGTIGPFKILGKCYISGAETEAATYVESSEEGSYGQSYEGNLPTPLAKGEAEQLTDTASGETAKHAASFLGPNDGSWALETADGSLTLNGFANQGVWLQGESGAACSFSGYTVEE
jgi:hypothetical protein